MKSFFPLFLTKINVFWWLIDAAFFLNNNFTDFTKHTACQTVNAERKHVGIF